MIYGERSNGKTYAVLEEAIILYFTLGKKTAVIRRFDSDFKGGLGQQMFENFASNGFINFISEGQYNGIKFQSGKWYFAYYDPEDANAKPVVSNEPFAFAFGINTAERYKSSSFPDVGLIVFDEFLTRKYYLNNEFIDFMNLLSTIIRDKNDIPVYMLGNSVNRYCIYFDEMGLNHVLNMKPGDLEVYTYGKSDLRVAVEYTLPNVEGKGSDVYFAFDNPRLNMITSGGWEIDSYPHLKHGYAPKDVCYRFYISFNHSVLKCDIVNTDDELFIFIYPAKNGIKDETALIFSPDFDTRPNWRRKLKRPVLPVEKKIYALFMQDKIFYANNDCGETVRNYLIWCDSK